MVVVSHGIVLSHGSSPSPCRWLSCVMGIVPPATVISHGAVPLIDGEFFHGICWVW